MGEGPSVVAGWRVVLLAGGREAAAQQHLLSFQGSKMDRTLAPGLKGGLPGQSNQNL